MPPEASETSQIYEIKVTLAGSKPPIWRRIQVRGDASLAKLHRIVQAVMGWEDSHLHQFVISDQRYGIADEIEESTPRKTKDERRYKLSQVVPSENFQFVYCYDFGDNWEHDLLVEKILPSQQGVRYPVCIDGARACPPEDVGGIGGYEEFLEAINDPDHPSHTEFWEWLGRKFDPEHFDMEMTNRLLR